MDRLGSSLDQSSPRSIRKWAWAVAAVLAAVAVLIFLFGVPRFIAVYELYWSKDNIQRLFYEDLGLSQAWSSFIAVVGSFFYALAWVPLTLWTYRVLFWRFNARQFSLAFACWVFVYGHVPLLHALLGSDACFNQRTGAPMKWYVQDADGRIVLFDSEGFDTVTRAEKRPVTPDICSSFARQKLNDSPQKLTANVQDINFFDPTTGRPRVWYHKARDGSFELFNSRGFHPATSDALLPVTKDIVVEISAFAEATERARKAADEAEAKKRADAEAARRRVEQQEARRRAEAEEARRLREAEKAGTRPELFNTIAVCDGMRRTYTLTETPVLITTARNCFIDFNINEGTVVLLGPSGEERVVTRAEANSKTQLSFRTIQWKSQGQEARVLLRLFCQPGTTWLPTVGECR